MRPRPAGRSIPQKQQTAVKAICRPVTAFCALVAIPIFPRLKTAHIGPQNAQEKKKSDTQRVPVVGCHSPVFDA